MDEDARAWMSRLYRGLAVLAVMGVTLPGAAHAAPAEVELAAGAGAAGLAGAPCAVGCCVPVRVVLPSPQPASFVDRILRVVDRIWARHGIGFRWTVEPLRPARPVQLRVVLQDGDQSRDSHGRFVVASIPFLGPARPHTAIDASVSRARAFARSVIRTAPTWFAEAPGGLSELLVRALGRAVAHEIGHYLSASPLHAPEGLMRAVFGADDLLHDEPVASHLTAVDLRRIWREQGVLHSCAGPQVDGPSGS